MLHRLIKKIIAALQWRLGRFRFRACGFEIGKNLIVRGDMYIEQGENSVGAVGNDCNFTSAGGINPLSQNLRSQIRIKDHARLIIGNNCGFSSVYSWAHDSITIGNHLNIGAETIILDFD